VFVKKTFVIMILVVILGALSWEVYQKIPSADEENSRRRGKTAVPVEIKPVLRTTIRDVGLFTGTLYPRSKFIVAPKIAGRLEKLNVDIGDEVKDKEVVAVLEDSEYVQQVDQARAELEVAKANLEETRSSLTNARRELARVKALRQKKIASESELDSAEALFRAQEAKFKVAQAQIAQKQAALKAAQIRLSYTKICVSCEGADARWVVGEKFVDEGSMLAANSSIVSVLDIGVLTAVVHVIEREYAKVRIGQTASVNTDAYPGKTLTGRIVRLAPQLKETSREARVEIEIENREGLLKPGMFVRVRLEFEKHENATVIPQSALVSREGRQGVFSADVDSMTARFVPLTLGISSGESIEVLSPSLKGPIITLGQHLLEDGSSIVLPGQQTRQPRPGDEGKGSKQQKGPRRRS